MNINKTTIIFLFLISIFSAFSQEEALLEHIKKLDASWEKAQLELKPDILESLLAKDFIWIHNHANVIDDKARVLERINRYIRTNNKQTTVRDYKKIEVILFENTAVVTGLTTVTKNSKSTTYNFLRTYVKSKDKYFLLANQTMAVPEK